MNDYRQFKEDQLSDCVLEGGQKEIEPSPGRVRDVTQFSLIASTTNTCSTGSCGPTSTSLSSLLHSFLSILAFLLCRCLVITCAVPSIWYAIRNAPTLQARSYLILTCIRMHFLFGIICSGAFLYKSFRWTLPLTVGNFLNDGHFFLYYDLGFYIAASLAGALVLFLAVRSVVMYRRILREETDIDKRNEKTIISYSRLKKTFFGSCVTLCTAYLLTVGCLVWEAIQMQAQGRTPWQAGCGMGAWEMFFRYHVTLYTVIGFFFLCVFTRAHRCFLAYVKDENAYAATPPILDDRMPMFVRYFFEWIVSFGMIVLACLLFMFFECGSQSVFSPLRSPFLLLGALLLLLTLSVTVSVFNTRHPYCRCLVNPLAWGGLIAMTIGYQFLVLTLFWTRSKYYPFQDFFDSSWSWPLVFVSILLCAVIFYSIITSLVLGFLLLRSWSKGNRAFFNRKTLLCSYGIGIALILCSSFFVYVPAKYEYFALHILVRHFVSPEERHAERLARLADEMIQSGAAETKISFKAMRGRMYQRLGKYDLALADLNDTIDSAAQTQRTEKGIAFLFSHIGDTKLLQGDYQGAIAAFDKAISELPYNYDIMYHRGLANELSGNREATQRDYSAVIERMKLFQSPYPVCSILHRKEGSEERYCDRDGRVGYKLSKEGLQQILDRLSSD